MMDYRKKRIPPGCQICLMLVVCRCTCVERVIFFFHNKPSSVAAILRMVIGLFNDEELLATRKYLQSLGKIWIRLATFLRILSCSHIAYLASFHPTTPPHPTPGGVSFYVPMSFLYFINLVGFHSSFSFRKKKPSRMTKS